MASDNGVISLPKIPKDRSYEDYLAAHLNAGGYYLERGVHMKAEGEILELDIVVNEFKKDVAVSKSIVEVKSGKNWGFPEIFKVKGWMSYLGYGKAAFIVQATEGKDMEFYRRISSDLDIALIVTPITIDSLDDKDLKEHYAIMPKEHYDATVSCLRFAFALEHKLADDIINTSKSNGAIQSYQDLRNYLGVINDSSFFESKAKDRVQGIFSAYQRSRNITARIDQEKGGKTYISLTNDEQIRRETYEKLFYTCIDTDILYASLYVELLEKLYILKSCVEDMLRPAEQKSLFDNFGDDILPSNIREGMETLKEKSNFHLYPYFWQMFIFLFGGFILNDNEKKDKEYALLSEITGLPQENIDEALEAFDILFPLPDGSKWLYDIKRSNITMLMFMPVPMCGIGVNFRLCVYTDDEKFATLEKKLTGEKTFHDFVKWNNLAATYLQKSKDLNP